MSIVQGPRPSFCYVERQLLTRLPATPAAPSTPPKTSNDPVFQADPGENIQYQGDGLTLGNVSAIVVSVYAQAGKTLSGGGSLKCWIFNPYGTQASPNGVWTRCTDLDIDLTSITDTPNAYTAPTFRNVSHLGMYILWLASGVTVSGGPDVLVRQDAYQATGGQAF